MGQLNVRLQCGAVASLLVASSGSAGVTVYGDADEAAWFAATPGHTTITFAEFPTLTTITDQYADLGVLFTDGIGNVTFGSFPNAWLQDGWGLSGGIVVDLQFSSPMVAFAAHFPGVAYFKFYAGNELIFESSEMGGSGLDWFGGFTLGTAFDRIVITGQPPFLPGDLDFVNLDNIYFKAIPAPGVLALFTLAGLGGSRSRRRSV